eukprot:1333922-Amphidinium_carterae.1
MTCKARTTLYPSSAGSTFLYGAEINDRHRSDLACVTKSYCCEKFLHSLQKLAPIATVPKTPSLEVNAGSRLCLGTG